MLNLKTTTSDQVPMKVNGRGKVANFNADLLDGMDSTAFAKAGDLAGLATKSEVADEDPILKLVVSAAGEVLAGSGGTVVWDPAFSRYEITIPGVSYFYARFVTVVTPTCDSRASATSVGGKLLVELNDPAGNNVKCAFNVVTWKP